MRDLTAEKTHMRCTWNDPQFQMFEATDMWKHIKSIKAFYNQEYTNVHKMFTMATQDNSRDAQRPLSPSIPHCS